MAEEKQQDGVIEQIFKRVDVLGTVFVPFPHNVVSIVSRKPPFDQSEKLVAVALMSSVDPSMPMSVGVLCKCSNVKKVDGDKWQLNLEMLARVKLNEMTRLNDFWFEAEPELLPYPAIDESLWNFSEFQSDVGYFVELVRAILLLIYKRVVQSSPRSRHQFMIETKIIEAVKGASSPNELSILIDCAAHIVQRFFVSPAAPTEDLQYLLEQDDLWERMHVMTRILETAAEILTSTDMASPDTIAHVEKDDTNSPNVFEQIKDRLPPEVRSTIETELEYLQALHPQNPEYGQKRGWVDFVLGLPWQTYTEDTQNLKEVRRTLDEDHAGLQSVKERILEHLAVRQLNPASRSPILCFVGPPGVGKTSLGQSIARATNRRFARVSLGGLSDESEIRGHRRTYIGSFAGRIMSELRRCGSANPVFMLDEIEKIGKDWRGDPASALLEVLDPEQNSTFHDRYVDMPFDLSRVLFITTANILETMHPALRDRMEIIKLPGYTPLEKLEIGQSYLVPRRKREDGFPILVEDGSTIDVVFTDEAITECIYSYTSEAGVRNLEKQIDSVLRRIAKITQEQDIRLNSYLRDGVISITKDNLHEFLGKPQIIEHVIPDVLKPGVVPILAVSDSGGHVFEVEVSIGHSPPQGQRKIKVTGVLGPDSEIVANKVEESLKIAFTVLSSRGGILFDLVRALEEESGPLFIECNVTSGAIPKDGPSAGVLSFIALYGALTEQSIKPTVDTPLLSGTGEITQKLDAIRAVGGIRDKILAAHRHGIKRLIIPKENGASLEDVPKEVRREIEIRPMSSMFEALAWAYPNDEKIRRYLKKS